jgi:environmental stress-induced protein Ves
MKAVHLTARDYVRQPWKNGGGTTTEIARHDEGRRWLWRVSIADVERSGPFSHFVGYDRIITLLEGDGMTLRVDGAVEHTLERHRPFGFDGGAATEGVLAGGPVKDLNLMVDRERAHGRVAIRSSDTSFLVASPWVLVIALEGEASLVCEGEDHRLRRGEALRLDDAQDRLCHARALEPGTVLAEIRIDRKR